MTLVGPQSTIPQSNIDDLIGRVAAVGGLTGRTATCCGLPVRGGICPKPGIGVVKAKTAKTGKKKKLPLAFKHTRERMDVLLFGLKWLRLPAVLGAREEATCR